MADDATLKFGATIEGVMAGIEKIKEAISSIASPLEAVKSSFKEITEIIAAAFAVEKISEFVEHTSEMGEQVVRTAAKLGATVSETQELGFVAKVSGTSVEALAMSMTRLQTNLQRAQNPSSVQAKALHELGLNAKEMLAVPVVEQVGMMADAYKKLAEKGINPASAGMLLMSRGALALAPLLLQGREKIDELIKSLEEAGGVMSDKTIATLDQMGERIKLMGTAWDNLKGTISAALAPAFQGMIRIITDLIAVMKQSIDQGGAFKSLLDTLSLAMQAFDVALALVIAQFEELWEVAKTVTNAIAVSFTSLARIVKDVFTQNFADIGAAWKDFQTTQTANLNNHAKNMVDIYKKAVNEIQIALGMVKLPDLPLSGLKPPNMDLTNQGLKLAVEKYQEMIKEADAAYKLTESRLTAELKMHEITQSEETRQLLDALSKREAAEQSAMDGEIGLYHKGTIEYQKALDKQKEMHAKYILERQNITQKAAEAEYTMWKSAADQISGAINGQIKGLLAGTTSLGAAMKSISADIALKFIQDQIKVTVEWLANQARILAGHIAAEAGMTAATTTGAAIRTATEVASGQTSIFATIASAIKSIWASAGQTSAEVTAAVAPAMGPAAVAAPAVGAAAGAATAAGALGLVASAEIGGYVTNAGLLNVHAGETITPAKIDQPYQGPAGGAPNVNMTLSSFNPAGLQQLVLQMLPQVARELATYQRTNPSTTW